MHTDITNKDKCAYYCKYVYFVYYIKYVNTDIITYIGGEEMAKTRTSSAVKQRYNEKVYDRLSIVVPKGRRAELKKHAESQGESLNGYIVKAVEERISRETN